MVDLSQMGPAALASHLAKLEMVEDINEATARFRLLPGGKDDGPPPPRGNGKLALRPARLPNPETLLPRQWLYGTQLIRGFVTVLVAPGGTGKSAYAMAVGIALAAHRSFLGDYIFAPVNVAVINLDDPMDELERRVAAGLAQLCASRRYAPNPPFPSRRYSPGTVAPLYDTALLGRNRAGPQRQPVADPKCQ
jgi:Mrp family chromosome partitioning ATPase